MRIFFIGSVEFSATTLSKVISLNQQIVGVVTKSKSVFNQDHKDLSTISLEHGIPYKYVKDINAPHILDWIASLSPDIIFCFGWSGLIKRDLLELPSIGVIGYHPAELPANRGRHPLIWALVLGLTRTASTFFFMDEGADTGDILSQQSIEINEEDDARSLYDKMTETALKQIESFVPQLCSGTYTRKKQESHFSNHWRKRSAKDGRVDFRMSTEAIYNLVRGLTKPYAGAHILMYDDSEIKVWRVKKLKVNSINLEPGKVLSTDEGKHTFIVKTYDGAVEIAEHEFVNLPEKGSYL